jgi:hypothetical protein
MRRTELPERFSMAKKALLQGDAGNYRIRGTIWELGSFAYRAYLHLVPTVARSNLSRWVVSADGMSLQEVLGAAKARVNSTVGTPVERLEVLPRTAPTAESDPERSGQLRQGRVRRRYPPPTD